MIIKLFTQWIQWILLIVDIISIFTHLRSEYKKRKKNILDEKPYRPTFRAIIQFLLLIMVLFSLILYQINPRVFELIEINWTIIWKGILLTLSVSLLSILFGSISGLLFASVLSISKKSVILSIIDAFLQSFNYIFLGIPALVLLFIFYYGFSTDEFWACVCALSVNLTPFVAKIITGSIRNISNEEIDSAISFGYTSSQIFWTFKVKHVLKNSIQPLFVEYYTTIKLSSLAGTFILKEFFHATKQITAGTQETINSYIILGMGYVMIVTWIAVFADYLESKWKPITD